MLHEVAIRGTANAKTEDARWTEQIVNLAQRFSLVADEAVGEKADEAQAILIMRKIEAGAQAIYEIGAAAGRHSVDAGDGMPHIGWSGFNGLVEKLFGAIAEPNHLKCVALIHVRKRVSHSGFRLFDGPASHAARDIQRKDHFQRLARQIKERCGGHDQQREVAIAMFV